MHKTKKKVKTGKIPKPIKIKKEKTEEDRSLHPMSHYIDDRLELVKQVFGSLKPKTITNLAPDFLKSKGMDEIEEHCLNELLGISTKRLLSIINATKCPTDTESSGDSDVEHQEEHISLEEISSDSEIEGASSNAKKKKASGSDSKTGVKKPTKSSTEKDENNGQISVLELLELQARARAIRSQLALEPVTKIEVDSDAENIEKKNNQNSSSGAVSKEHKHKRRRKSSEKSKEIEKTQPSSTSQGRLQVTAKVSKGISSSAAGTSRTSNAKAKVKENEPQTTSPNKLKRNYRSKNNGSDSVISETQNKSKTNETDAASLVSTTKEVKKETKSRSPTPDVIPIIPEPETLLISDSSDGEHDHKGKKKTMQSESMNKKEDTGKKDCTPKSPETEKPSRQRKITEPEEGELVDNPVENDEEKGDNEMNIGVSSTTTAPTDNIKPSMIPKEIVGTEDGTVETSKPDNNRAVEVEKMPQEDPLTATTDPAAASSATVLPKAEAANMGLNLEDEDDRNDDVISLEGGDLEEEMIEHLEEDTNTKSSFATSPKRKKNNVSEEPDADVISLDSSEEEERDKKSSESWHSRYLKSSKVSKVLATSRLGKRVRDNIQKSKRSKKDSEREKVSEVKEKSSTSFASKHEDGSIEQYKELLAMRQRKKQ
ncbi:PH domain-containing protein DDB_G0287875-like [Anastrepha obliqua]|uniref:PH domain-containing protein DDB_G0287875-like n=1 Tax=Anastrepha obliqua TaxID=95512 RepID=UPI002409065A|nr:PH domain-containing protein DDB_G0287875-like [Anastrepha obliqua]